MIIVSLLVHCVIATTLMTGYSYALSAITRKQFREPELLNGLMNNWFHKSFPKNALAGWLIHYGVGFMFIVAYRFVFQQLEPTLLNYTWVGFVSGLIGAAVWFVTLNIHPAPPPTHRAGYYAQLVPAHIIFALGAFLTNYLVGMP
ncbi:MAG: hypothetical protein JNK18_00025 [Cyclobacteriaceae bacterium]|nr:hypothetical protein [Cyclobacteriaceae bacterium]